MTIPALSLDDLTYEDLRQMAMRRIPAASGGRWTHHEPVDAGVTLIELFAFLLEQQLFVLDQVPDSLTHALLALLGEAPRGAGVARTLVAPVAGTVRKVEVIPTGTELRPEAGGLAEMVFSTEEPALALPVTSLEVLVDGMLASDRLDRGVPVPLFEGSGSSVSVEAVLGAAIPVGHAGEPLTLALILSGTGVASEWEEDAADVAPATGLTLSWDTDTGTRNVDAWEDGTRGLRRSGLIRLPLPEGAEGATRLRLTLSGDGTAFARPPRLRRAAFGGAPAAHRRSVTIGEETKGSTPTHDALLADLRAAVRALLPNSGQTVTIPAPLTPALAASIRLSLTDRSGTFHDWHVVTDLTAAGPEERVFAFDRLRGVLSFGDGYAGRPPAPAGDLRLTLDVGGGTAGNHAAGMTWRGAGSVGAFVSLDDATGGREPETPEEARDRVAASLGVHHRAVTAADYVALAESTPGIGPHRAHLAVGFDPSFPCLTVADSVTVFVVPRTDVGDPSASADDGALMAIGARLDAARMLTTRVFVARPTIRPVSVTVGLAAAGSAEAFAEELRPVLASYLHPSLGGASGEGWPFGGPLRPSELLRVAGGALVRSARVERVSLRLADQPEGREEDCTELAIGPNDLVRLAALRVTIRDAARQEVAL